MKTSKKAYAAIFFSFFVVLLLIHVDMTYISDDLVLLTSEKTTDYSLIELFDRYYNYSTGKIFTDVLGNLLLRIPFPIWKTIDSIVYIAMAFLIVYIFAEVTPLYCLVACLLLLTFPKDYLKSAGYIMTTTNYIYPFFCVLLVLFPIKHLANESNDYCCTKTKFCCSFLSALLPIVYATNQDQSAMALIGILFLYVLYRIIPLKEKTTDNSLQVPNYTVKEDFSLALILLIVSVISYGIQFFIPAHYNRAFSSGLGRFSIPDYNNWTLLKKMYHGYSTTVANIIFQRNNIYLITVFFIFVLAMLSDSKVKKIAGTIPLASFLIIKNLGYSKFVHYYPYCCEVPDLRTLSDIKGIITLIVSIAVISFILADYILLPQSRRTSCFCIFALIIGGGSHFMMGFSSTLYGSSFRTLSIMIFSLIITALLLFREIERNGNKTASAACICAIFLSFVY